MKKTILTFALLLGGITLVAQEKNTNVVPVAVSAMAVDEKESISNLFTQIPDDVFFGLQADQKITLTSYNDTVNVKINNAFGGTIERLAMSPDFISFKTSDAGTLQIKVLSLVNDTKMICVVNTVTGKNNVSDSRVRFYTTQWKSIDQNDLLPPSAISWFVKEGVDLNNQTVKNAFTLMDAHPMQITLFADNTNLAVKYDIKHYLVEDEYKKIQPYLTEDAKILTWDKRSYK